MAQELVLRVYQLEAIERFQKLPSPRRMFLAWDMGAGKTIGALATCKAVQAKKILIVCPAIVRPIWLKEAARVLPGLSRAIIDHGRGTKLSKVKAAERDEAHRSDVQVVSYDLLPTVSATGWDFVIVDEFHALRSVSSKQSKTMRALFKANPQVMALGLSGTPIPNECKQLWNPVDTFFPGRWGKQSRPGWEPYAFCQRYCHKEVNEYGTRFYGLKEERREELADRFGTVSSRVVQADFASFLPPLYVEPLEVEASFYLKKLVTDWYDSLPESVQHVGIYTHLRKTAESIYSALDPRGSRAVLQLVDGSTNAHDRSLALALASTSQRSIIVGTTHALAEGVSLSFQKAALVVEWTSDVSGVVQFIGRFARQDSTSTAPTKVEFVVGPHDVSRAQRVRERIESINHVIKESKATGLAAGAFAEREMSDEDFAAQIEALAVQHEQRTGLWSAGEDDVDSDD